MSATPKHPIPPDGTALIRCTDWLAFPMNPTILRCILVFLTVTVLCNDAVLLMHVVVISRLQRQLRSLRERPQYQQPVSSSQHDEYGATNPPSWTVPTPTNRAASSALGVGAPAETRDYRLPEIGRKLQARHRSSAVAMAGLVDVEDVGDFGLVAWTNFANDQAHT